jgi:transketolase
LAKDNLRLTFAALMEELGALYPESVVIVGDISHGIFSGFREQFPKRYFNIGILEPSMIGIAAGMSRVGLKPVVHTIAPFLIERSFEQIKLDFGYQKLSGCLVSVGGTYDYSQLGVSHHSYSDVSMMMQVESSSVFLPGSSEELRKLFIENFDRPGIKYFRLTENPHGIPLVLPRILGNSAIVSREGKDITLVTTGPLLNLCHVLADEIQEKTSVEIVYCPTLKPFDGPTVRQSLNKTRRYVTVEELAGSGGLFELVAKEVSLLPGIIGTGISVQNFIHEYGSYGELQLAAGLSRGPLLEKITETLHER